MYGVCLIIVTYHYESLHVTVTSSGNIKLPRVERNNSGRKHNWVECSKVSHSLGQKDSWLLAWLRAIAYCLEKERPVAPREKCGGKRFQHEISNKSNYLSN